jgi:anti-sigma regulatory factor (Ser/Thr protein kinase)
MAREARRLVTDALVDLDRELVEVALLLSSEVVTNAFRYGATTNVWLALTLDAAQLRVEVADSAEDQPHRRSPGALEERGRGLMLLDALASDWGTMAMPNGKIVWFRLALTPASEELPTGGTVTVAR